ncbi:MAG: hypothetical protein ACOC80_16660 [Petrotogales bacterium]
MYEIKNISNDARRIREHHTGKLHFIKAGESIKLSNPVATDREDVFEITDLSKKTTKKSKSSKSSKRTQKSEKDKKEDK